MNKKLILISLIVLYLINVNCGGGGTNKTTNEVENSSQTNSNNFELFKNPAPLGLEYKNNISVKINLNALSKPSDSKHRFIKLSLDENGQKVIYLGKVYDQMMHFTVPIIQEKVFYEVYGENESVEKNFISIKR